MRKGGKEESKFNGRSMTMKVKDTVYMFEDSEKKRKNRENFERSIYLQKVEKDRQMNRQMNRQKYIKKKKERKRKKSLNLN